MSMDFTSRPVILVYVSNHLHEETIAPVFFGIEEEQVPFVLKKDKYSSAEEAAYQAAQDSSLNVGIGYVDNRLVLHQKNLPMNQPYLQLNQIQTCLDEQLKRFGENSARLVKGIPLKNLEAGTKEAHSSF